jgi:two-component system, cell cycle sensor histidine kinase and response regulator CckA
LGYVPGSVFGGVHPEDEQRVRDAWRRSVGGADCHVTYRHRHADGSWRWMESWGSRVDYRGALHVLAVSRDITELCAIKEQLLHAQKMEVIGRLAGGVAHDFNNLLTIIVSYSDFIRAASDRDDERRRDAEEIQRAANRASLLTQQLLAFSRRRVAQSQELDLNAVTRDLSRMLDRLIGEDVALELRLAPDAGRVYLDEGRLQQVLMNLVINARDGMPDGGRLTIETGRVVLQRAEPAEPSPLAPGTWVRLAVSDTGVGMSADVLSRVFEPFFTTKDEGKGTGLGLAMVYEIATQAHGRLRVASAPDEGTTFEVFFPPA